MLICQGFAAIYLLKNSSNKMDWKGAFFRKIPETPENAFKIGC
jgi:hypothetical protein